MEGLQLLFLLRIGDDDDFGSKKCGRAEEVKEEILKPRLVEYEYQRYLPRSANLNCPV
jgi:hypothetical protein